MGSRPRDLVGTKFTKLTPIRIIGRTKHSNMVWECRCDCGNLTSVAAGGLRSGKVKSCGCYKSSAISKSRTTHGETKPMTPEYSTWSKMKYRCSNPRAAGYENYGGRGIKICKRWQKFENFLADMGRRPGDGYSLERINSNGDYRPSNCVWATKEAQMNNTRRSHRLTVKGETRTLAEWARSTGIKASTIRMRLSRGWSPEQALTRE